MNDRAPPLMTLADFIVDSRLIADFAEDAESFSLLSSGDGDMQSFRLPILRLLTCDEPLKIQVPHKHGYFAFFLLRPLLIAKTDVADFFVKIIRIRAAAFCRQTRKRKVLFTRQLFFFYILKVEQSLEEAAILQHARSGKKMCTTSFYFLIIVTHSTTNRLHASKI